MPFFALAKRYPKLISGRENGTSHGMSGARAIEMDVVRRDPEIIRTLHRRAHRHGFVTPLEDMTPPRVPSLAECPEQILHPGDQVRFRCL